MRHSFLLKCLNGIPVSVGPLKEPTEPGRNVFHETLSRLDVEDASRPDGDAADMGSGLFPRGNRGPYHIPGLESKVSFPPGEISPGEPEGVEPCPLVGSPSGGLDRKNRTLSPGDPVHDSDAHRIQTMGLGETEPGPVPLRASSGSCLDRKARGL